MSYDLAVWEGDVPQDDKAAAQEFEQLYERYFVESPRRAHGAIRAYVEELTDTWPEDDKSPWVTPPMETASGPIVYFSVIASRADEVCEGVAQIAADHGLVCFDANRSTLRGTQKGLSITTRSGRVGMPALWFAFVLNELRQPDSFITVGQPRSYARAANEQGTLVLEYREAGKHFQVREVPLDRIADALSQWAAGQRQFIARHSWRRLQPEDL
ncbi:hypothetical protein [Kribbella qitaiheensis]|uniref:hypothetical protein n=1 Tax=Kribbella qitaiheensis TaxID=1544730 RepID=UPI001625F173|nr:hypothetical protein [Kribbella qitaiheensis]